MPLEKPATGSQLTLGEILSQPSLGLTLISGEDRYRLRPVTGAHSFEISHPTRWFSSHWIALTTGLRLKGKPEEQRLLVEELANANICALGFALDVNFKQVPTALIEAAKEFDLPLFTVPFATGFAEIIAFINQSLLSPNVGALRRFVSVQDYLLDALLSPSPIRSLIERLAPLVSSEVAFITREIAVGFTSDSLRREVLNSILIEVSRHVETEKANAKARGGNRGKGASESQSVIALTQIFEFETDFGPGLALAVLDGDKDPSWLTLVQTTAIPGEVGFHLSLPLIRSAGHILSIALQTRNERASEKRALERALLIESLAIKPTRASSIRGGRGSLERLIAVGIDFSQPVYVAVSSSEDIKRYQGDFRRRAEESGAIEIDDVHDDRLIALIQCDKTLIETLINQSDPNYPATFIGLSRAIDGPNGLVLGYREALSSLSELEASNRKTSNLNWQHLIRFEDVKMATWLLAQVEPVALAAKQKTKVEQLEIEKHTVATLIAYLECNLDITEAAKRLAIHPNSMRYRLNKVRESLGIDLDDFEELVDVYLALKRHRRY
ncbi:MAG: PucR family transcriptional regulator ligand-binding domain-containing protein [Actinomycetota bacterium]|nr:PucR family transcriptional regulator ligand-binding domain-containing protein [Actinomycetota bacterium]